VGVNNDNPCPVCDNVYSDYAGNSIFTCRGCGHMFNNETKVWDIKGGPKHLKESKNDGGSAFPAEHQEDCNEEYPNGMSLRDYFAGQALAGCSADYQTKSEETASWAYILSDAMLKERDK